MQLSIRAVFAAVLWVTALVPPVLWIAHATSPEAAVRLADALDVGARWGLVGLIVAAALGAMLYPPFLPTVRLAYRRTRSRLGTDTGPLREAQERLQHLETAADRLVAGRALFQLGKVNDALPHLVRAVELDPEHAASRYQLGLALVQIGQLQAAAEQLAQVVQREPSHAFGGALLELGVVLERGGAYQQAVEAFDQHEQQFGPNRRVFYHRARAQIQLGNRDAGLANLREAAQAPKEGERLNVEDELVRAKARVALLKGGRP